MQLYFHIILSYTSLFLTRDLIFYQIRSYTPEYDLRAVNWMCSYALNHRFVKNTIQSYIYAIKLYLHQNFFLLVHVKLCDEFQQQFSETCGTNPETAFYDLVFDHLVSPCINEFLGLYSQYHRGMRCYSHVNFFMGARLFALDRYYLH